MDYTNRKYSQLDYQVERTWVNNMRYQCELEVNEQRRRRQEAQGWFFQDDAKMRAADEMPLTSCNRLRKVGIIVTANY
jgi:DnaJ homolog subfamily B member 12